MIIKNKLQKNSLKNFSHIELEVNDMHIISDRKEGKWYVKIFHDGKDTHKREYYTTQELITYLNAYIETARTQIKFIKE